MWGFLEQDLGVASESSGADLPENSNWCSRLQLFTQTLALVFIDVNSCLRLWGCSSHITKFPSLGEAWDVQTSSWVLQVGPWWKWPVLRSLGRGG